LQEEAAFRLKMIELADANQTKEFEDRQANIISQSEQITKEEEDRTNAEIKREKDSNDFFAAEAEKAMARDKEMADQKKANQDLLVSQGDALIQNVSKLAGKNKAIQKAAIIAEGGASVGKAVANTSEAVTKDLAKGFPFSAPLVALDVAVGATSVASIIKGTSDALKAVGGGGSVGGGSASSLPARNVAQVGFQSSSENQISTAIAQQQKEQPPIQAFVVSQAVTDQQEIDRKKQLNNSF